MYIRMLMARFSVLAIVTPFTDSLIAMGGLLVALALLRTMLVRLSIGSWFAFILFLIYITGVLVLFGYMLAIRPNNYYTKILSAKFLFLCFIFLVVGLLITKVNVLLSPMNNKRSFEYDVIQIYSRLSLNMYWFMAVVLLVALLIVVILCYKSPKPLRSFLE